MSALKVMNRRTPAAILLLEEQDAPRATHAEALRQAGLDVTEVADSEAALDAAKTIRPRVIVASFDSRTREDRLSFCREIKADPSTNSIPILLTAADVTEEDTGLATDPGVLVLTLMQRDSSKLVAAVEGVLAGERAEPLRASLRRRKDVNRSA
jgi:CheY-like chemotaxis protein